MKHEFFLLLSFSWILSPFDEKKLLRNIHYLSVVKLLSLSVFILSLEKVIAHNMSCHSDRIDTLSDTFIYLIFRDKCSYTVYIPQLFYSTRAVFIKGISYSIQLQLWLSVWGVVVT